MHEMGMSPSHTGKIFTFYELGMLPYYMYSNGPHNKNVTYLTVDAYKTVICITIDLQSFIMFWAKVFVLLLLLSNALCLDFFFTLKNFKHSKVFWQVSDTLKCPRKQNCFCFTCGTADCARIAGLEC